MYMYIKALADEINDHPELFNNSSYHTLLELLWHSYTQEHPISADSIDVYFTDLEYILKTLSNKRRRKLLFSVHQLCYAYERDAFLQGIRVGVQLLLEIRENL